MLGNNCLLLPTFSNIIQCSSIFGKIWQFFINVGNIHECLAIFYNIEQSFTMFANFGNFAIFDRFWPHLETFVILLSCHPVVLSTRFQSSCHPVILSSCHSCHSVLLSSFQSGSLSIYQLVILLACELLSL